jgi:tight adherence protein C
MLYLIAITVAMTVGLLVYLVGVAMPTTARPVRQRLVELGLDTSELVSRRRRQVRRESVQLFIEQIGTRLEHRYADTSEARKFLIQAGYRGPNALSFYWGLRAVLAVGLGVLGFVTATAAGWIPALAVGATAYGLAVGYVVPVIVVRSRRKARQKELTLALPDALDLLVVCVEAGLGLNQALQRVALESRHISVIMTEELALVNLEIRAGTEREQALMNLAERTGVDDIRSLVTMLIQTDRFGTSIAQSLRVQSDTLRMKRRQRAEEAAAKTAIKMVFPLVFCIFPALFVVILGAGLIQIFQQLGGLQVGGL